jgi:transposase
MSDQVRTLVLALLPSGGCSVERVTQHLGVEPSTVQRRLARSGESHSSILDAVRSELVTRYVETHSLLRDIEFSSAYDRNGPSLHRLAGGRICTPKTWDLQRSRVL